MAVGLIFARCFGGPPDGGGHGGHGAKGGSAGSGAIAGTAGVSSGGMAGHGGDAGHAGDAGGAPSEAGHGGLPAAAGEGGVPNGEGGAPGGEGGDSAGAGGFGGVPDASGGLGGAGVAGSPSGGQGGEGEMACDVDLLPVQAFANASWSEYTYCEVLMPRPGSPPCPTTFPPVIVDGELRFNAAGRPGGGSIWRQAAWTTLTIPAGTHSLTTRVPSLSCGSSASVSSTFNGALFQDFISLPPSSSPTTGRFEINFTQTSGPPCSYTLSDVWVRAHRC